MVYFFLFSVLMGVSFVIVVLMLLNWLVEVLDFVCYVGIWYEIVYLLLFF